MTSFTIQTSDCSFNLADAEQMAGLLTQAKFNLVENLSDADIVIFNTGITKTPSEIDFFKILERFKKEYPYKIVIISGCISQADSKKLKQYSFVGTKQIHKIVQVVEEALHDNVLQILNNDEIPPLNLPRVRKNPIVGILPINRGCLGACMCKTKKGGENLVSYPIAEIIQEASKALREGVKEIWLTSQDTFCYGFDIGTDLPTLLEELVKLPQDFKIRIGMGNPHHMARIGDKLIQCYKHEKIFKLLHLPAQAGHNDILKEMLRNYTVEDFISIVKKFRQEIVGLNLMTDIIVGYPTETDMHYWGTLELVGKTTPDTINISSWLRSETATSNLKELPKEVVKHRLRVLTDIFHNISKIQNEKWRGWCGEVLIDEKGKEERQWIGRNFAYKPVLIQGDFKLGDIVNVKIVRSGMFELEGEVSS